MAWQQVYNPAGSMVVSTLLAAIPVVMLLIALAFGAFFEGAAGFGTLQAYVWPFTAMVVR